MLTKEQLADSYALNLRLIRLQTKGLSHADSLAQSPYNINCLNWVLGHIAVNRERVLKLLGEDGLMSEAEAARYRTGSEPITADGEEVIPLERLLEILTRGQERIHQGLTRLSEADLRQEIEDGEHKKMTLFSRLHGFYFHDTYHTGQTDLLRQVAGANDKII